MKFSVCVLIYKGDAGTQPQHYKQSRPHRPPLRRIELGHQHHQESQRRRSSDNSEKDVPGQVHSVTFKDVDYCWE